MASKAFVAVARSVHTVVKDPDDDTGARRLFGTPKNNLGLTDLPVMSFTIGGWWFDTDDGRGSTGQLTWGEDVAGTIGDILRRADAGPEAKGALAEAVDWLDQYMAENGPRVLSSEAKEAAKEADISADSIKRARKKLSYRVETETTFPRRTWWVDDRQSVQPSRGDTPLHQLTQLGDEAPGSAQSVQSVQSVGTGESVPPLEDARNAPA